MDPETYEQTENWEGRYRPQAAFLDAGMKVTVEFVESKPVGVLFPDALEVTIAETAPPMHQPQDSNFKPAKLENGIEVMAPQFVKSGDVIRLVFRAQFWTAVAIHGFPSQGLIG